MGASEIKVDQLMHEIRHAVAQRRGEKGLPDSLVPSQNTPAALERPTGQIDAARLVLQPDFHPPSTDRFHVSDLLKYHGRDFVRNAYRAILRREPDGPGLAHHVKSLASGRFNKIDILASLSSSPEGKHSGVKITGLAWPATIRRMGRIPVIGYCLQMFIAVVRLPRLLRNQRQFEFYYHAQQEQIVEHENHAHRQTAARTTTIEEKLGGQQRAIESLQTEVEAGLSVTKQQLDSLKAAQSEIEARAIALSEQVEQGTASLTARADQNELARKHLEAELQKVIDTHQRLLTDLGMQERRLGLLLERARNQTAEATDRGLVELMSEEEDHLLDGLYASFEDQFRGEREEIKSRLSVYLPILEQAGVKEGALDIGCGRGEWLELLRAAGVQARGVDHNRVFIERCKQLDLDVVEADALTFLRNLPDQGLNAVTSFHLVEHLPFKDLLKLLDEMVRTLKSGGLLILETPNPENFIVASHTFYTDPTHRNPIPSATLRFLLESRGLDRIEIMNVRPWDEATIPGDDELTKRFNEYFYSSPDYGIVGWKT